MVLGERARAAFAADLSAPPPLTLRGADAVDSRETAPPFDPALDAVDDAYLERYAYWGLPHLDPVSWRHYLPALMDHALRGGDESHAATEALLFSLRPPDREPPRFGSLTSEQVGVVVAFLMTVAGDADSAHREGARLALREYWGANALFP